MSYSTPPKAFQVNHAIVGVTESAANAIASARNRPRKSMRWIVNAANSNGIMNATNGLTRIAAAEITTA
jgi:hypothetical protein